jgi:RNA polymerase sigma factor (sigma-70 family)
LGKPPEAREAPEDPPALKSAKKHLQAESGPGPFPSHLAKADNVSQAADQAARGIAAASDGLLEAAFARHQSELLGTLYYLVGHADDARDALQETFLKCWRHRDRVSDIANLKAWIFCVALNTGRDLRSTAWRRRRESLAGADEMIPSKEAPPDRPIQERERLELVRRAVRDLRPEEQEVFLMRQNGELTYEEIAHAVGIPTGTVKTRMRLALEKLRKVLVS